MAQNTYGKTNLIDDVTANTTGYTRKAVAEILETALTTIQRQVQQGNRVTITGFGTWQQSERAARMGTNIRTGQKIQIPAQRSVRFNAGSDFKNAVKGTGGSRGNYAKERSR